MAYRPLFEIASFESLPAASRCRLVLGLVRALVAIDLEYLARNSAPPLYKSGVRYRYQGTVQGMVTGIDHWWDVPTCLQYGEGSCEDLACWRAAELQLRGERGARPFVTQRPNHGTGQEIFHIIVIRGEGPRQGQREDPSRLLGMVD